jgi:hypothetical protein
MQNKDYVLSVTMMGVIIKGQMIDLHMIVINN